MRALIVFSDGTSFVGDRNWKDEFNEPRLSYHFTVVKSMNKSLVLIEGEKITVPISSIKFFVRDNTLLRKTK